MSSSSQNTTKKNKRTNWLPLVSLVAIVAYIILVEYLWGWSSVLTVWQEVGVGLFVLAMALIFVTHLVRGFRIFMYFKTPHMGFVSLFYLSQTHNLLNNLLPFRSGEVSFPLLMKSQFQVDLLKSASGLLWLRVLDAHCLGMFALTVILVKLHLPTVAILLLLTVVLLVPLLLFMAKPLVLNVLENLQSNNKLVTKVVSISHKILAGLPKNWRMFITTWVMTWLNWLIKMLLMGLIVTVLLAVDNSTVNWSNLSWNQCLVGLSGAVAGEITSILPINAPAGVGTYAGGVYAGIHWLDNKVNNAMFAGVNLHLLIMLSAFLGVILASGINALFANKTDNNF